MPNPAYSFARVSAAVAMQVEDFRTAGGQDDSYHRNMGTKQIPLLLHKYRVLQSAVS
jgi:hypothetical protein